MRSGPRKRKRNNFTTTLLSPEKLRLAPQTCQADFHFLIFIFIYKILSEISSTHSYDENRMKKRSFIAGCYSGHSIEDGIITTLLLFIIVKACDMLLALLAKKRERRFKNSITLTYLISICMVFSGTLFPNSWIRQ